MNELVILVGPPGCGKSTLYKEKYSNYEYVNQDSQGREGHMSIFKDALTRGDDILVDRMNFNKEQRSRYTSLARKYDYHISIHSILRPYDICYDRCRFRENHETIKTLADAAKAISFFHSSYERVTHDEGDIVTYDYGDTSKFARCIVCDLDGTLCNIDHRLKYVKTKPKRWKEFLSGCVADTRNEWCYELVSTIGKHHPVVFASGRSSEYYHETKKWLESNGLGGYTAHLYMRNKFDRRMDCLAKESILDLEILTRFKPMFFIDDRKQVVDMWRRRGFICLQCADGNF